MQLEEFYKECHFRHHKKMAEENSWTRGPFGIPPVTQKATSFVPQDQQKVCRFPFKWSLRFIL